MSDHDRGQQRPGQTPGGGVDGSPGNGAPHARPEELAATRASRQPTPQSWPNSPGSGPSYQRPPQHVTQQYPARPQQSGQHGPAQGQQPPRVQGQPGQPPQPFPSGYSSGSAYSAQSAQSSATPGQLYRPDQPSSYAPPGPSTNGRPSGHPEAGSTAGATAAPNGRQTPDWGAAQAPAKPKVSLRERLGLTRPASEKSTAAPERAVSASAASSAPANTKPPTAAPLSDDSTQLNPKVRSRSDGPKRAAGATATGAAAGAVAGAAAGAATGSAASGTAARAGGTPAPSPTQPAAQPAARQAPVGTPVPPAPGSPPAKTDEAGPNTLTMPAVASGASAKPSAETPAAGPAGKMGQPRRTRKARLRLSRLDPWSVMKTSFLFSIAAGIMLVVAVYVVWTVLASSGLFSSMNEIVGSVISTPGDTTPFRVEDYVNTQKVMGVTALVACVDVVIFTSLATLGSFLYNLAATMLGGLEITLAED